jgi:hypothetical protein
MILACAFNAPFYVGSVMTCIALTADLISETRTERARLLYVLRLVISDLDEGMSAHCVGDHSTKEAG